jgi:hypothetical protein
MEEIDPLHIDRDRQGRELSKRSASEITVLVRDIKGKKSKRLTLPVSEWRKAKRDGYLTHRDTTLFVNGDSLLTEREAKVSPDKTEATDHVLTGVNYRKRK